jgi:predicted TIM-barrel fold metal-dependent hydrolase
VRSTAWGDLTVADAHVHFFSHAFLAALAGQKGGGTPEDIASSLSWEAPDADPAKLAGRWASELDRHGVDKAALIASVPGDESSVAAAIRSCPDRFYGYSMFNPLTPNAGGRAERAFHSGIRGLCLFPAMHGYSLHDDRITAVFEAAAGHPGAVVFVHCGVLTVGVRRKLGLESRFDLRYSNPVDVHARALQYPKLPFVIPHFGAGNLREALMVADLCPNVYLDTSSSNSWMRYEGLTLASVFERAIDVAGPERLLFGTDSSFFPRGWNGAVFEAQAQALASIGVDAETARMIFGGNLLRLLSSDKTE